MNKPAAPKVVKPVNAHPCARVSLRFEDEQNFRLRIFAAHARRSVQEVLSEALNEYLDRMVPDTVPGCACVNGGRSGCNPECGVREAC